MFNWELILHFCQALGWPVLVLLAILMFKGSLAAKIADVKSLSVPGADLDFETRTKAVESRVERLVDEELATPDEPAEKSSEQDVCGHRASSTDPAKESEPPHAADPLQHAGSDGASSVGPDPIPDTPPDIDTRPEWLRELTPAGARRLDRSIADLMTEPDFDEARRVVTVSTPAAVMLAHGEMERCLRAAWTLESLGSKRRRASSGQMVKELGLDRQFGDAIRELTSLRNDYAHGGAADSVPVDSALAYIDTCEAVAEASRSKVLSKVRHPSGSHPILKYLNAPRPW